MQSIKQKTLFMALLVLVAVVYMAESGVILHADDNIKEENAVELSENRLVCSFSMFFNFVNV